MAIAMRAQVLQCQRTDVVAQTGVVFRLHLDHHAELRRIGGKAQIDAIVAFPINRDFAVEIVGIVHRHGGTVIDVAKPPAWRV
ncbi:hypothetical protein [Hyphomonas sp.]|uniref:hypothetical protein n=1 Tax=Hyphomonas sp. TaxID=87 RepID=UPI0025BC9DB5|nr:hypothetical protein [Hyphomonas sp.]